MNQGLGTQLRHLLDLLDGAVEESYADAKVEFRPRFTPIVRALLAESPCGIGRIAQLARITQPAATQTVALMSKAGLLEPVECETDGRQRLVRLSPKGRRVLPRVRQCWQATQRAADELDSELPVPLSRILEQAIEALEQRPFRARIAAARRALVAKGGA